MTGHRAEPVADVPPGVGLVWEDTRRPSTMKHIGEHIRGVWLGYWRVEVKSGMKVRPHAAFDNLLSVSGSAISEAFVLSRENVARDGRLTYLPLWKH